MRCSLLDRYTGSGFANPDADICTSVHKIGLVGGIKGPVDMQWSLDVLCGQ
jgi:hypothetical protein